VTPEEAARARRRMRRRIGTLARSGVRIAGAGMDMLAGGARMIGDTSVERLRARRQRRRDATLRANRTPLPSLYELHPEARRHMRRELGLRSIPLDEIAGTAVAGPAQRGSDFRPLPSFRSTNWEARWQRINRAVERLEILPPIDVLWFDGRYWVEDGHNRVAAALKNGQVEIDAAVTELRPPNAPMRADPVTLAPMLDTSHELRAAGEGRFSAAAASHVASSVDDGDHDHDHDDPEADDEGAAATDPPAQSRRRTRPSRPPRPS
jgi:hypothetical protein